MRMMVDISDETAAKLDHAAERSAMSRSELVEAAIERYVMLTERHVAEIEAGLREAEAGIFADDAEVEAFFALAARAL